MVKIVKIMIGLVAALMLFFIVSDYISDYRAAYDEEYTSTTSVDGEEVVIEIPKNSSAKEVAQILYDNDLIKFKRAFVKRLQNSEYRGKMQAGTFTLHKGMNTLEMMEIMAKEDEGSKVVKQLVIPEGFTIDMIGAKCEEEGICKKSEFVNAVKSITTSDFEYLEDVPSGVDVRYKLEGYLFPATYDITKNTKAIDLVHMMLNAFDSYYTEEMRSKALEMGYNSYQILTVASMIEREAKIDSERPKIASVIYNRIEAEMLLQVDSTTLYPLTEGMYDVENLSFDDLSLDSPYNTYVVGGLPVGPICNPGLACINAALNPEDTNYLYYHISDEEKGEHVFTETFEEHESTQNGGADLNGDGIPDVDPNTGNGFDDNNAADDVWSNNPDPD
ncbi:MAG: endolytic transglycosylase MltG [Eubacterium sp.]|nr:endolytic transglycosylase MltG [Eubacterium sp.]